MIIYIRSSTSMNSYTNLSKHMCMMKAKVYLN